MYSLKVQGVFSSAHNLRGYKGKCEDLHGHNWRVEIIVKSLELDNIGMVLDFKFLKKKLSVILEEMDHKYLNKLVYYEVFTEVGEAILREKKIKGGSRQKKIAMIISFNPQWLDLYEHILPE